jgi:glucose-6-phosphate 1-dehydrogenase
MRPKKPTNKSSTLSIRLYPTEKIALNLLAKTCGLSLSDYLRKAGLNQTIKSRFTQEELSIYQMLVDYRNHFTHISNLIKKQNQLAFKKEVQLIIEKIDHHLNKIIK